jgi:formate dehydrogenase gamma subunit
MIMSSAETNVEAAVQEEESQISRFPILYRLEHWIFAISFITLGITGLIQKFFRSPISVAIIEALGGIQTVRIIHRVAATTMMVIVVWHIGVVFYRLYVERYRLSMMPTMDDARNGLGWFLYNLGARKKKPQEGRYTYGEKLEYWAVVWGTVIMVITGFMMWNPIATTRFLDGQWIPAAKVAHGGEAVLAVLAIIIWHLYNVLVKTFNKSIFTGKLTEEQMEEEHPLELADIKAGVHDVRLDPKQVDHRKKIFYPVYSVIGLVLLLGIVWFVTFEQTALRYIPPVTTVTIFSPLTPTPLPTLAPTPTPIPTPVGGSNTADWNTVVFPIIQGKCLGCHGENATSGLNLSTFQGALQGGDSGPAVVPGEPDSSRLVAVQSAGGHPGQLSASELQTIIAWIEAGAPESLQGAGGEGSTSAVPNYVDQIGPLFEQKCGACHGAAATAGLNLTDYQAALKGGNEGPVILPGDQAGSLLIQIQAAGGHPIELSASELDLVRQWIEAGAPETAADVGASGAPTQAPAATETGSSESGVTYTADVGPIFQSKCSTCHGDSAMGGLNLTTYEGALTGGKDGPVVISGDPAGSLLVEIQQEGGHPGQLSDEELQTVMEWIEAGLAQ